jgi:hypothetical protein
MVSHRKIIKSVLTILLESHKNGRDIIRSATFRVGFAILNRKKSIVDILGLLPNKCNPYHHLTLPTMLFDEEELEYIMNTYPQKKYIKL